MKYTQTPQSLALLLPGKKVTDAASLFWMKNRDGTLTGWQRVKQDGKAKDIRVGVIADLVPKSADLKRIRALGIQTRMEFASGDRKVAEKVKPDPDNGKRIGPGSTLQECWTEFEQAMRDTKDASWSADTRQKSSERIQNHIAPCPIWKAKVGEIKMRDVLTVLTPIRQEKHDTEKKVRGILSKMFTRLVSIGVIDANPCIGVIDVYNVMAKAPIKKKQPAIVDLEELRKIYRSIGMSSGSFMVRQCLRLQALTALRSSEVAGAAWEEINLDAGLWIIPRERMKMSDGDRPDLVITLTEPMIKILREMNAPEGQKYVFSSDVSESGHITIESLSKHFRHTLNLADRHVPHGWRSSLSTLAKDVETEDGSPKFAVSWIDAVLDHREPNKVRGAYDRGVSPASTAKVWKWWSEQLT
jgi:integrase